MLYQPHSDPADQPTDLFDQVFLRHVSNMRAELLQHVSIMRADQGKIANLERECENLRHKLSIHASSSPGQEGAIDEKRLAANQTQGDTDMGKRDNSAPLENDDVETTDMVDTFGLEVTTSAHFLVPELGLAKMSDSTADKVRAVLVTVGWRATLQRFVLNPAFESFTLLVVVFNVVILGIQTNKLASNPVDPAISADAAFVIEAGCCIFFVLEVGGRIIANWKYFFEGPGWALNILDFVLVVLQISEVLISLFLLGKGPKEKRSVNFAMWRILRLARVVRLFRSARVLAMFSEVRSTALAVILSIKPLCGAMIIMLLLYYSFSIILIELAIDEMRELEASEVGNEDERLQKLKFHFGSLGSAIITLLHCSLTSSASYGFKDISALFDAGWVQDLLIPCIMTLSMLGMLNIITGIFVDSTTRQIEQDEQDILETIASDVFHKPTGRQSTVIRHEEFSSVLDSGKGDRLLEAMKLDRRDVRNLWSLICFTADSKHESLQRGIEHGQTVQIETLVSSLVKMSGEPRRIDILLVLGMLEELAETSDHILQRCVSVEASLLQNLGQITLSNQSCAPAEDQAHTLQSI